MHISDLKKNYTAEQLSSFPGDPELRRTLFTPFLQNLYEDKVVYYERFMCVARIEEMIITPERFSAKAKVHLPIEKRTNFPTNWDRLSDGWHFGGKWEAVTFHNKSFGLFYTSVVLITDPDLVKEIEGVVLGGQHMEAVRLIHSAI